MHIGKFTRLKALLIALLTLGAMVGPSSGVNGAGAAGNYRTVPAETLRQWQGAGKKIIIVDIQTPVDFEKRHLKSSIETNAYPVKTPQEKQRLDKTLEMIKGTTDDVVIVCPRGGGGARNTYDYLRENGIDEKRLLILEKGIEGWPYPELCDKGR